ncbi:uncharacterized protein I206_103981 [Kwoniella pini CBS 10737]|uniref:Myb-like domain-containing protein n=1 Tax=Kwoniella pini CBS 10737 TaxID=1296096 RepID=A0A1B9I327_9TREE|nr:uncharacterized protein I206_04445 [Kwoniella pini CBS 10737]OCF49914.1 hypothetical protein I206_04445 [Kwoniella pini CBS 10737]
MPIKRENPIEDSNSEDSRLILSTQPKKVKSEKQPSSTRKKQPWTDFEEKQFKEAIHNIVKKGIWSEIKMNFPDLSKRGADGVSNHWAAMYKKMQKP